MAHHKVVRKSVWQVHCKTTIALIDQARRQGMDVKVDQYPYNASATTLDSNAPLWAFEGGVDSLLARLQDPETRRRINAEANASHVGRWGDIFVSYAGSEKNQWAVGKSILEIAKIRGVDPADACFDLIVEERCRVGEVNYGMCEEDITYIMRQPYTMIGSDGNAASLDYNGQPHPPVVRHLPQGHRQILPGTAAVPARDRGVQDDRVPRLPPGSTGPRPHEGGDEGRSGSVRF